MKAEDRTVVDCEAGRRLGCRTFCCRLLVRLQAHERDPGSPKSCVDKAPDGLCLHIDRATFRCAVWEGAPAICRAYDCSTDPLLQIVLREGFSSLVQLVGSRRVVPKEEWITIPRVKRT